MTSLVDYRAELRAWLDANHGELAPCYEPPGALDDHVAQMQRVKGLASSRPATRRRSTRASSSG